MRVSSGIVEDDDDDSDDDDLEKEREEDAAEELHGVVGGVGTVMPRRPAMRAKSA